jgi:hypothetical protein
MEKYLNKIVLGDDCSPKLKKCAIKMHTLEKILVETRG